MAFDGPRTHAGMDERLYALLRSAVRSPGSVFFNAQLDYDGASSSVQIRLTSGRSVSEAEATAILLEGKPWQTVLQPAGPVVSASLPATQEPRQRCTHPNCTCEQEVPGQCARAPLSPAEALAMVGRALASGSTVLPSGAVFVAPDPESLRTVHDHLELALGALRQATSPTKIVGGRLERNAGNLSFETEIGGLLNRTAMFSSRNSRDYALSVHLLQSFNDFRTFWVPRVSAESDTDQPVKGG